MKSFTYKNAYCELSFKPDRLNGRDVYNVSVDGEHATYMTEELVKAIKKKDDMGSANIDSIKKDLTIHNFAGSVTTLPQDKNLPGIDKWRGNVMSQFILLDLPNGEKLNYQDLYLAPTLYRDGANEVVTIRPVKHYLIANGKRDLELKFKDNDLTVNHIFIKNKNSRSKTTIELNFGDKVADEVKIFGLQGYDDKPIYLYLESKENSEYKPFVDIENVTLPYREVDKKPYYMKFFGRDFVFTNSRIVDNYNILHDECYLKTSGLLKIKNSTISIGSGKERAIAIESRDKIETSYCNLDMKGVTLTSDSFDISGSQGYISHIDLLSSTIKGALYYGVSHQGKEGTLSLLHANIDLGEENTLTISGNVKIKNTTIKNNKSLYFYNVRLEGVNAKNISGLKLAEIYYTNLENFTYSIADLSEKMALKIGNGLQDREKIKTFKNTTIALDKDEIFKATGGFSFEATNSSFKGDTEIVLARYSLENPSSYVSLKVENSLFSNSKIALSFSEKDAECSIVNSEIKNKLKAKDLLNVNAAYLNNVYTANISEIKNISLENYNNVENTSPTVLDGAVLPKTEGQIPIISNEDIEIL